MKEVLEGLYDQLAETEKDLKNAQEHFSSSQKWMEQCVKKAGELRRAIAALEALSDATTTRDDTGDDAPLTPGDV